MKPIIKLKNYLSASLTRDERRIKTFKGSQVDDDFLDSVIKEIGQIDIVIDDGSHINEHVIHTFKFLFPRINCKWYVIEDVQTSYWPGDYGGMSKDLNNPDTIMGFFKHLLDGLNHVEYKIEGYQPTYFDRHIIAMHLYHNMIFIQKGSNDR
jgi:cephalosporin hydroxylase